MKHRLLSGEILQLDAPRPDEVAFLANLRRMAREGVSFFDIERIAIGPGSPALAGWSRVTPDIVDSPLYRVAADIATRAGIDQGLILAPRYAHRRHEIPADRSMMSVTQAATTLRISRAAVHKAIQQKRLAAKRFGNVVLVRREDVARYKRARSTSSAGHSAETDSRPLLAARRRS